MSTTKLDTSGVFQPITVHSHTRKLLLAANQVVIRKNGLEFAASRPIPVWTELTVELRSGETGRPLRGSGVVVDCAGNRHSGYIVSLMFMNLTRHAQERLTELASSYTA
jgi:hypothetical protein